MSTTSHITAARTEVIVVGAAATETAARAVDRAAELAASLNARLFVVTAYSDSSVDVVGAGSDTFELSEANDAAAFADQTAGRLSSIHGIEATGVTGEGKPDDVILGIARDMKATLIVVGNVRMQGPGRLLGSVANGITHHAPCDVLVVKTA
ncbi:MAG TPA: universal stress protein [Ilumatobacter sp.]|nr:universal stress protein [Ilumatobacter sp.]